MVSNGEDIAIAVYDIERLEIGTSTFIKSVTAIIHAQETDKLQIKD